MAELDRLLGATPRLAVTAAYDEGRIAIDSARLTGTAGRATARGLIGGDGALRLALDWDAEGPFGVGPVAIDGAMTGEGALTGTLSRPRADLTAQFAEVAAGPLTLTDADLVLSFRRGANASDGRVALTADSNYGPARASGDFFLADGGVRLSGVDVNAGSVEAQGDIALVGGAPASADLTFTARQGAFLASGQADGRVRLTEGAGSDTAILDVTGRNVRFAGSSYLIRTLDLEGRGTLSRLPFTLTADVVGDTPVEFDGSGVYARANGSQTVTLSGDGRVREIAFNTRSPAVIALAGAVGSFGSIWASAAAPGGRTASGQQRLPDRGQSDQREPRLPVARPARTRHRPGVPARRRRDLSGSANLTMTELRSVDAAEGLEVNGTLDARLAGDTLHLRARAVDEGGVQASAELTLPVETSAAPLRLAVNRTRPMSGEVSLSGQVQPIWDIFLGGEQRLAGQVDGQADIAGSINDPRITGTLDVREGMFRDTITGVRLEGLTLAARFDGESAQVQTFSANDGSGGTVSGSGRMNLRQGSASSFTLNLSSFRLIDNEIATADASGPVTVTRGADGNIQLMGRLNIDEAEVAANPLGGNGIVRMDVIEVNRPGGDPVVNGQDDPEAERRGPTIGLDIVLRSPNGQVWVRGRGLNVEMNVNARVRGSLASPQLTGTAQVVRGDYDFAGKRFVFDERGTVTLSTNTDRIRLDLRAVREDPALTAEVRVTGTAASPEIELTSTPQLPQDEILSQVLFGRSASQLSAFEAAQLASGVASLAGGGGFDVLGNLREFAGLDRLSFGGDASALTVAGGRYLTDNVYFEVIGGGEAGGAVQVEWQVRRNIAVTSRVGGDGDARLAIRWRNQTRQPGTGRRDRRPNRTE
ncbi:translocation/assembly module TamB domain-containing protein [Brevundimonas denitrificans]|uniref:translocation/assembly module TamB domain-containing protein n=1 Tax=Brevundimonas denitrificans TaxID=1443434 RepID=UPI0021E2EA69|nr:translocation/assembly module TamB domain-containing protein [Brevundimonas denitrificans]